MPGKCFPNPALSSLPSEPLHTRGAGQPQWLSTSTLPANGHFNQIRNRRTVMETTGPFYRWRDRGSGRLQGLTGG